VDSVIYGSLLGDASLYRDKTTFRLDLSHGEAQKAYLIWKARKIGCLKQPTPYITGYGSRGFRIRYYDAPRLSRIARDVLRNGVKRISKAWLEKLDDLALAVWYQDDGSWGRVGNRTKNGDRSQRRIIFNIQGFDSDSIWMLSDWLTNFGFPAYVARRKGYEVIVLNHTSTVRFWNAVAPYLVIPGKVDLSVRPGIRRCGCGVPIEPRDGICLTCLKTMALDGKCSRFRLIRRFGTSRLDDIRRMKVEPKFVATHWVDASAVGTKT
jgi:hypothetical protein